MSTAKKAPHSSRTSAAGGTDPSACSPDKKSSQRESPITRYIPNVGDAMDAMARISRQDDGSSIVQVRIVDQTTGKPINSWSRETVDEKRLEDGAIQHRINHLLTKVLAHEDKGKRKTITVSTQSDIDDTQKYWSNIVHKAGPDSLVNPAWAEHSTLLKTKSYLQRQVLPRMDAAGADITDEDMAAIRSELIAKALANDHSKKNPEQTAGNVDASLYRINYMLQQLYLSDPTLPRVLFPVKRRSSCTPEQAKSIPDPTRVRLVVLLLRYGGSNGPALAVALMLLLGLRTAEAAAVRIGDLVDEHLEFIGRRRNYLVCFVRHQMKLGQRVEYLKSIAAYRIAVGTYLLMVLIRARINYLLSLGYTAAEIRDMPLAGETGRETECPDPSKISALGKELLLKAGYTQDALAAAKLLQTLEPDLDAEGNPDRDLTAYILRRDWCSRACNVCGLNPADVDYLIGHANKDIVKDYTSPDIQAELADMLENYVFHPAYTLHPRYCPLKLSEGLIRDLPSKAACTITNDTNTPMRVLIDVTAREPGVEICGIAGMEAVHAEVTPGAEDTPEARQNRYPLGRSYPIEYYNKLIAEAEKIDLP